MKVTKLLDAASGVGYGSNFLANNQTLDIKSVDRSTEALQIAKNIFSKSNILFFEDDCHTLKNASEFAPYDCIVSFETLEHLPDPSSFIKSCFNNLRKGGALIVSTPNQPVSSPSGVVNWEFHEKEYSVLELHELLISEGFSNIEIYGQKYTSIGKLRSQFRAELNIINSSPFIRLGRSIQKYFRRHSFHALLPEQAEDFEIINYKMGDEKINDKEHGPFVLIAVCTK